MIPGRLPASLLRPIVLAALASTASPPPALPSETGALFVLSENDLQKRHGTGFVVKREGNAAYVVTADHVVGNARSIFILFDRVPIEKGPDGRWRPMAGMGCIPEEVLLPLAETGGKAREDPAGGEEEGTREGETPGNGLFAGDYRILDLREREYLFSPAVGVTGTAQAELFHLLPAVVERADPLLDVALLRIDDFPACPRSPVLYLDPGQRLEIGDRLKTSGCEYGAAGFSALEAEGRLVSSDEGYLFYESGVVKSGFSGGPVLSLGHVVGMNCYKSSNNDLVRTIEAASIAERVDEWIGLPRMRVDTRIADPPGAADGVVTVGQEFTVRAEATLDPEGTVPAPAVSLALEPGTSFTLATEGARKLYLGGEAEWRVLAPPTPTDETAFVVRDVTPRPVGAGAELSRIPAAAEESSILTARLDCDTRSGSTLFLGQTVRLAVEFEPEGTPLDRVDGEVALFIQPYEFEIVDGSTPVPIRLEERTSWRLEVRGESRNARISFRENMRGTDRNGMPVVVRLPEPLHFRLTQGEKFQFYFGIASALQEGKEPAYEVELGPKFRLHNIDRRGIPIYLNLFGGAGYDNYIKTTYASEFTSEEITQWLYHIFGGAGLSARFGPIEFYGDFGVLKLYHDVEDSTGDAVPGAPDDGGNSTFTRFGFEYAFTNTVAFYAGVRSFTEDRDPEYLIQMRLLNGR